MNLGSKIFGILIGVGALQSAALANQCVGIDTKNYNYADAKSKCDSTGYSSVRIDRYGTTNVFFDCKVKQVYIDSGYNNRTNCYSLTTQQQSTAGYKVQGPKNQGSQANKSSGSNDKRETSKDDKSQQPSRGVASAKGDADEQADGKTKNNTVGGSSGGGGKSGDPSKDTNVAGGGDKKDEVKEDAKKNDSKKKDFRYGTKDDGSCWRAERNSDGTLGSKSDFDCDSIPKAKESTVASRNAAVRKAYEESDDKDKNGRTRKDRYSYAEHRAKDDQLAAKENVDESAYRKAVRKHGIDSQEAKKAKRDLDNTRQMRTNYSGGENGGKIGFVVKKNDKYSNGTDEPGATIVTQKDIRDYKKERRLELNKQWNKINGAPKDLQTLAERNRETNSQIKEELKDAKEHVKEQKKKERQDRRQDAKDARKYSIDKNCGNLGGFDCQISDSMNEGIAVAVNVTDQVGAAKVEELKQENVAKLTKEGTQVKQSKIYESTAQMQREAASSIDKTQAVYATGAAAQLGTSIAHFASKSKVNTNAATHIGRLESRIKALEADIEEDGDDGSKAQEIADLEEEIAMTEAAQSNEISKQTAYGVGQLAQMAATASNSIKAAFAAATLRKQAEMNDELARIQENMEKQTPYNFNWAPNGVGDADTDMEVNPYQAPTNEQYAAKTETPNNDLGDGMDGGNLGLTDGNIDGGGPAGGFQYQGPQNGGGGGGLSGTGAGGVSASSGGGSQEPGAPKSAKGSGKYAAGDAKSQARRYGAGNGGGVGIGNGLSDMLKKLMGQAVDEKKARDEKGFAFEGERAPSSEDAAAVIPRNGDLFRSIHSRYQKKSQEGAIVFVKN